MTILCPSSAVAARVEDVLDRRGWRASVQVLDRFSAAGVADAVGSGRAERVVVDPHLPFPVSQLRSRLPDFEFRELPAAAGSGSDGPRLRRPTGRAERATLFALSFGFYLLLGEPSAYDVATGLVTAVVAVLVLSRVTFSRPPTLGRTLPRIGRAVLFFPYLVWKILAANVALAAVLLDPRLPIEPSFEAIERGAADELELAVLGNSITLTPGTLTVEVRGSSLLVHTLTEASRDELRAGGLVRAVRYVFQGRRDSTGEVPPE